MALRNEGKYNFVANDDMGGGDSLGSEGGDVSGGGGGSDSSGGDLSDGGEINGNGTGDIPTIGAIMDRAAASSSSDALPGFTTKSANVTDDSTDKPNPNDFLVDTPTGNDKPNPNDFPANTGTADDSVPEMTITDKREAKADVPELVITGDRPVTARENVRSIDTTGAAEEAPVTPALTPITPATPVTPAAPVTAAANTPVTSPVVVPVAPTPPVVSPPTGGPAAGETEEEWRLRMGLTGTGNLTDFDKEIARLKGNMDTSVATSKGVISANMKPPGG
ncbi:hypothetical protein UFOVP123_35 [uncultured Caudovirales phage]|uniref:Uncharacterized protein n=1 Tax=uncultured Caudovirales phage TaxID=2100421 RepID=A0A6J5L819_9CAUD|nr:hypothetical protein UFOVP123_35 [uncultured Caudovirales phage]